MICDVEEIGEADANGWRLVRCRRDGCRKQVRTNSPLERIELLCKLSTAEERAVWGGVIASSGPGTELLKLTKSLNIKPDKCGGQCARIAREMDQLGIEGVRADRQRFVDHLNGAYRSLSRWQALEAAARAVAMGLIINPLDPAGSLLSIALERAEKATTPPGR